jgi:hypothetical protein
MLAAAVALRYHKNDKDHADCWLTGSVGEVESRLVRSKAETATGEGEGFFFLFLLVVTGHVAAGHDTAPPASNGDP